MSQSSEECIFCFEEISKFDIAVLNCPHKYHLHCIQKWNKTSKDFTKVCPQCNIQGEIFNIIKGEQSPPISPEIISNTNTISVNRQSSTTLNHLQIQSLQEHTYYDNRLNIRDDILIDRNNQVIIPRREPSRRNNEEETEPAIICCVIL